jgi:predicted Zn-dependent peptidase
MPQRSQVESGATVVTEHLPGVASVAFGLYFPTGSRHETAANNGISHFIEHLVFKGTNKRSADEINREIDRLGGVSNAYTTKELICFYARVLGDHLPQVVEFYSDMATDALPSGIDPEVEREREVILQEISSVEDSPEDLVGDLVDRAYFGDHSLALPIVGSARAVGRLDLAEIRSYVKRHLVARDLVVAACGAVDHEALCALVDEHLSALPPGQPAPLVEAPQPRASTRLVSRQLEQVQVCLSAPGIARNDDRRAAADLLNSIVGEGFSSRLFREVRDRRGLAYSIYSGFSSYLDAGSFNIYFGVAPEKLAESLDVVGGVLGAIRDGGISADELEQAKVHVHGATVLSFESNGVRLGHLAEKALLREERLDLEADLEEVAQVRLDELNDLAAEIFAAPLAVGVVGPVDASELPAEGWELSR